MAPSAVGLVVKYLVAIEMPRVRFPDGASIMHTHTTSQGHSSAHLCTQPYLSPYPLTDTASTYTYFPQHTTNDPTFLDCVQRLHPLLSIRTGASACAVSICAYLSVHSFRCVCGFSGDAARRDADAFASVNGGV